jgi:hypothetical protein
LESGYYGNGFFVQNTLKHCKTLLSKYINIIHLRLVNYSDNPCIATFHLQTSVEFGFFRSVNHVIRQMTMFGTRLVFAQLHHFEIPKSNVASRPTENLVFSDHFWMDEGSRYKP